MKISRRDGLKGLLGLAALSPGPGRSAAAQEKEIPPQGIGNRFHHLSYSDLGGRPDSVQVMLNRRHLYVGHMFSNGVTILDAADPRKLKPVNFFTGGDFTRTHHLQVSDDLLLLANGANIVAMQSYDNIRGYFENALADMAGETDQPILPLALHRDAVIGLRTGRKAPENGFAGALLEHDGAAIVGGVRFAFALVVHHQQRIACRNKPAAVAIRGQLDVAAAVSPIRVSFCPGTGRSLDVGSVAKRRQQGAVGIVSAYRCGEQAGAGKRQR